MNESARVTRRLQLALAITVLFVAGEAVAGVYSNSLALVSDAAHNFTDALALLLSWYAIHLSTRPASAEKTYGYHRAGILAALLNAASLILIALYIFYEAYRRVIEPPVIDEGVMVVVAVVGFVVNTGIALALHHFSATDLNIRAAFMHQLGDAAATLGVILTGIAIALTGWTALDPLASVIIAAVIAWSSWGILREGVNILLEGTPRGIDLDAMIRDILRVEGVQAVHDLHAWSITSDMHALSAHVLTDDVPISRGAEIQRDINAVLMTRYNISHTALQLECAGCNPDRLYCELGRNGGEHAAEGNTTIEVHHAR